MVNLMMVVTTMMIAMEHGDGMPGPSARSCIRPLHRSHTAPDDCYVEYDNYHDNTVRIMTMICNVDLKQHMSRILRASM